MPTAGGTAGSGSASAGVGPGWYGYGYPYAYGAYGYPYGGYPYGYYYDYSGAARLQVKPREAQVFIDGYFVGTVDDFDGWAQRLYVAPGEHELAIYLKGHRTFRQNVLFRPGATLRIEHVMQPLAPGDAEEPRPVPSAARAARRPRDDYPPRRSAAAGPPAPARRSGAVAAPRRGRPPPRQSVQDYGSLAVRVQPLDAEVFVDGESWQSPEAGSITLQLSEGIHRVEVRKDGLSHLLRRGAGAARRHDGGQCEFESAVSRSLRLRSLPTRQRRSDNVEGRRSGVFRPSDLL